MSAVVVSDNKLSLELIRISGIDPNTCYQCGRCSGACGFASIMQYSPAAIMRLLQLGKVEDVLSSNSLWVCTTCANCDALCPREIKFTGLISALRLMAQHTNSTHQGKAVIAAQERFMVSLRAHGRVSNPTLSAFLEDLPLAYRIVRKGRVRLWPEKIKRNQSLKNMLTAYLKQKEEHR
ncbi:MAG: 4Fe-4S dicluster domain-containing protein [Peptococcaceae bacterium]|nr:4Fe-4S dicluster domain-containing protein [Peptococcaceae bacterium]